MSHQVKTPTIYTIVGTLRTLTSKLPICDQFYDMNVFFFSSKLGYFLADLMAQNMFMEKR